ncbi:MAG: biopolymer transporter ExbD [Verrucomicrobiales bacterium]|nr:biopolymer transporter ExbD [Verrucomicrobiales bacterium]
MRIASPVAHRKARFEIIPLIDIMFFLLASFMMVSLTMIRVQALKMDLPTPTASSGNKKPEMINLEVDSLGDAYLVQGSDRQRKSKTELFSILTNRFAANTNIPAYIKGSPDATHGQVVSVLDLCRQAGIQKVSFNITLPQKK